MRRIWGGTCRGSLLGRSCARTGRLSPIPAIDTISAIACSTIVGESHAALLSASPTAPAPTLVGSANITVALHNPSSPGSPSSCAPPPGEVGPVAEGSSIGGAVSLATVGCSMVGATRSILAHACSAWGDTGSSVCLSSSAADGYRTSVDSTLQKKFKKHTTAPKEYTE